MRLSRMKLHFGREKTVQYHLFPMVQLNTFYILASSFMCFLAKWECLRFLKMELSNFFNLNYSNATKKSKSGVIKFLAEKYDFYWLFLFYQP